MLRKSWIAIILFVATTLACAPSFAQDKQKKKDRNKETVNQSNSAPPTAATDAEKSQRKAERKAAKANETGAPAQESAGKGAGTESSDGGDESELSVLTARLGLSEDQKKGIEKDFEKYRSRLAEIRALPDDVPNVKVMKGPQRRALRMSLDKWVVSHLTSTQAEQYAAYAKKRAQDSFEMRLNNRVAKLNDALKLGPAQQGKVRELYAAQMMDVQAAADALYATMEGKSADAPEVKAKQEALAKELELKRDTLKSSVQAVLKPEQLELFKKLEDL